ncbi:MAG TPA: hypothetical protein VMU04_23210 [Candidatus Acidoferrum sp.]|nr:hypothetical protein [Candidatus Acidoferrum sp.]
MKAKPKIPQFELPQAETVFNLAPETATDGERLRREAEAKAQAQLQQDQKQPNLL